MQDSAQAHFHESSLAPSLPPLAGLPVLGVGVLEQLGQLQGVFADFLHRGQQEPIQGDVDHLLQQPAGLEEVNVLVHLGEARQLHAGVGVVVAVLRVDLKLCLLQGTGRDLLPMLPRPCPGTDSCACSLHRELFGDLYPPQALKPGDLKLGVGRVCNRFSTCSSSERPRHSHIS